MPLLPPTAQRLSKWTCKAIVQLAIKLSLSTSTKDRQICYTGGSGPLRYFIYIWSLFYKRKNESLVITTRKQQFPCLHWLRRRIQAFESTVQFNCVTFFFSIVPFLVQMRMGRASVLEPFPVCALHVWCLGRIGSPPLPARWIFQPPFEGTGYRWWAALNIAKCWAVNDDASTCNLPDRTKYRFPSDFLLGSFSNCLTDAVEPDWHREVHPMAFLDLMKLTRWSYMGLCHRVGSWIELHSPHLNEGLLPTPFPLVQPMGNSEKSHWNLRKLGNL